MKSLKNRLMIAVVAMFIVGGSAVSIPLFATEPPCLADESGSCGYKRRECLFKPDQKCSGNGSDCAVSDPCGNQY